MCRYLGSALSLSRVPAVRVEEAEEALERRVRCTSPSSPGGSSAEEVSAVGGVVGGEVGGTSAPCCWGGRESLQARRG